MKRKLRSVKNIVTFVLLALVIAVILIKTLTHGSPTPLDLSQEYNFALALMGIAFGVNVIQKGIYRGAEALEKCSLKKDAE